ncbi:MAG TPA: PF20097 family protein [Thermoplasmata archaeon]|nr:PF20097 family protein [Thermoplasmata archaeon]
MPNSKCAVCGGPLEAGFVSTTNGSGLFWAQHSTAARFRPKGLEVLVGTGFGGTYSANLAGQRCVKCHTILLSLPEGKSP